MVTLCYGSGILLVDRVMVPFFPLLVASGVVAAATMAWSRGRPFLVWPLLLLAGAVDLRRDQQVLSPQDIRSVIGNRSEIVTVRGTLCETPYHRVYEQHEEHRQKWRALAQLDVDSVRLSGRDWRPATGRIVVSTPGVLSGSFFGGRVVELEGILQQPRGAIAEGVFDYRAYLRRQGIYYQLQVSSTNDWRLMADVRSATNAPIADRFGTWARCILARGLPEEDEPLRLLWAMSLGWKTALSGEVSEPFMRSGTMHVFAISGLHIALIAGLLVTLLRVFRLRRGWCGFVVLPLIWCYTGVTGWQ